MSLVMFTAAAMLGIGGNAAIAPEPHEIVVSHRGATMEARYRAEVDLRTRQVGANAPTRMGSARCDWTAVVAVHREVGETGGTAMSPLSRKIDERVLAKGFRPGGCMETRKGVTADARKHAPAVESHLQTMAQNDRQQLAADLDHMHNLVAQRD